MPAPHAFLLIHSPLVGPSTWSWVAADLERRGYEVIVPDLRDTCGFTGMVERARGCFPGETTTVVGHSGAGFLLPFIGRGRASNYVFVDAHLPPASGAVEMADKAFMEFLEGIVDPDELLPPWHLWWSSDVLERMLPDQDRRTTILSDIPRLPLGFYSEHPEVPSSWSRTYCAYIQFSKSYKVAAAEAGRRGWPVRRIPGEHLHHVHDPASVAKALVDVAEHA